MHAEYPKGGPYDEHSEKSINPGHSSKAGLSLRASIGGAAISKMSRPYRYSRVGGIKAPCALNTRRASVARNPSIYKDTTIPQGSLTHHA